MSSFLKSYLLFLGICLFAYLAIGIAFAGEHLKFDPEAKLRKALVLMLTWGKYLIRGSSR